MSLQTRRIFSRAATVLTLAALAALTPAQAKTVGAAKPVSLTLAQQPVQSALKLLFKSAGKSYTIDPAVQGIVTLSVENVSFDVALRALLRANNPPLVSDIVDGVYAIKVKAPKAASTASRSAGAVTPGSQTLPDGVHAYRIPISRYDASMIALELGQAGAQGQVLVVPPNYVGMVGGGLNGGNGRNGQNGNNQNGNGQNGQNGNGRNGGGRRGRRNRSGYGG